MQTALDAKAQLDRAQSNGNPTIAGAPAQKQPPRDWIIKHGDLAKIIPEDSREVIVFENKSALDKIDQPDPNVPSAANAPDAAGAGNVTIVAGTNLIDAKPDRKEQEDKLILTHIVFHREAIDTYTAMGNELPSLDTPIKLSLIFHMRHAERRKTISIEGVIKNSLTLFGGYRYVSFGINSLRFQKFLPIYYDCLNYHIGDMQKYMLNRFFQSLVKEKILSEEDAGFFKSICEQFTPTVRQDLDSIFSFTKDRQYDNALTMATSISQAALQQHKKNRKIEFDNTTIAFELGEHLKSIVPQQAYLAFSIVSKASPLYFEAQQKMAELALAFSEDSKSFSEIQQRKYREKAMRHITNSTVYPNSNYIDKISQLLKKHLNSEGLIHNGLQLADVYQAWRLLYPFTISMANMLYTIKNANKSHATKDEDAKKASDQKQSQDSQALADLLKASTSTMQGIASGAKTLPNSSHGHRSAVHQAQVSNPVDMQLSNWIITQGERAKIDDENYREMVVYEKKIKPDAPAPNVADSNAKADSKEKHDTEVKSNSGNKDTQEYILTHVAFVRIKRTYVDEEFLKPGAGEHDTPLHIILHFRDPGCNASVRARYLTPLLDKLTRKICQLDMLDSAYDDKLWKNHPSGKHLTFCIGEMYKPMVDEFFDYFFHEGIMNEEEAKFFKSISGYKPPSKVEEPFFNQMWTFVENQQYDEAIQIARKLRYGEIYSRPLTKSLREKLYGLPDGLNSMILRCRGNPTAAFDLGEVLSRISPLHAYRSYEVLTNFLDSWHHRYCWHQPIHEKMADLAVTICANHPDDSTEMRTFREMALNNLFDSRIKGRENLTLFLQLLEKHAGFNRFDPSNRLFSGVFHDELDEEGLFEILFIMANKIYMLTKPAPSESSKPSGTASAAYSDTGSSSSPAAALTFVFTPSGSAPSADTTSANGAGSLDDDELMGSSRNKQH